MGRNLKEGPIRQQEQDQRDKLKDHDRKSWNLREDERRFILRDRAGPGRQGTALDPTMVTGLMIPPGVEMETPGSRFFEINEASVADEPRHQPDDDQEAGHDHRRTWRQIGSPML